LIFNSCKNINNNDNKISDSNNNYNNGDNIPKVCGRKSEW